MPLNSNLHVNRAIFYSQLDQDQQAIDEIRTALELNPHNYIAYFNRFSLEFRNCQDSDALRSLCCSLSCLHLMRAKKTRSIESAGKAIKYCSNNIEAHVLKGLILYEKEKYLESYYQF